MSDTQTPDASGDFVQSLARGLAILRAIGEAGGSLGVQVAAERTSLNRATARRLLKTLESLGYVHNHGREYRLSARVLELGYDYLANLGIAELVSEPLERLSDTLGEAVSVTVLEGHEIVYVARARPPRVMTVSLGIGARLPAWHTSMGRVLLSGLGDADFAQMLASEGIPAKRTHYSIDNPMQLTREIASVRAQGWCMVDQELELGLRSVAVPLLRDGRRIVAALNAATAHVGESPEDTLRRLLPHLQNVATEISGMLDHVQYEGLGRKSGEGQ